MMSEPILLMENCEQARNFPANPLPFRQDSTFWYFTGLNQPNAAWFSSSSDDILFLPAQHPSDILWHGPQESNDEIAERLGFSTWLPGNHCRRLFPNTKMYIALRLQTFKQISGYHKVWTENLSLVSPMALNILLTASSVCDVFLIIPNSNSYDGPQKITDQAHRSAMAQTFVDGHERDVAAAFHHPIHKAGFGYGLPQYCNS